MLSYSYGFENQSVIHVFSIFIVISETFFSLYTTILSLISIGLFKRCECNQYTFSKVFEYMNWIFHEATCVVLSGYQGCSKYWYNAWTLLPLFFCALRFSFLRGLPYVVWPRKLCWTSLSSINTSSVTKKKELDIFLTL